MDPKTLRNLLLFVFITEAIILGTAIGVTSRSAPIGMVFGVAFLALPFVILGPLIGGLTRLGRWPDLVRLYPAAPPLEHAARPRIISMALRWPALGFNNCVRAVTDDEHLHLSVALPFCRVAGVSIPWAAVTDIRAGRMLARLEVAGGPPVWVPKHIVKRELEIRSIPVEDAETAETLPS